MSEATPPVTPPAPEPATPGTDAPDAKKRSPLSPANFARLVLGLVGTIWLGIGAGALADPIGMADGVGFLIEETKLGRYEFRAEYGGLSLGIALLHYVGLSRAKWLRASLIMTLATMGGLSFGRLFSIAVEGPPGGIGIPLLMVELLGIGLAVWALVRLMGSRR